MSVNVGLAQLENGGMRMPTIASEDAPETATADIQKNGKTRTTKMTKSLQQNGDRGVIDPWISARAKARGSFR